MSEVDDLMPSVNEKDIVKSIRKNANKITFCISIIGTVIFGSAQGILIPLMTMRFTSMYFIAFAISVEITIILLLCMIIYFYKDRDVFKISNNSIIVTILLSGLSLACMSICKVYASNPDRTPPIMQSTLASTTIIFTVIFSKLFLDKDVTFNLKFIIPSVIFLICSICAPLIYELLKTQIGNKYLWILLYAFGIACRGSYTVFQEKYFIQTNDSTLINKIKVLFYTNLVQLILIAPSYPLEYIMGNGNVSNIDFLNSTRTLFTDYKASMLFQGFTLSYFLFLGFTIYLTTISSNYVMIISVIITPAVTIFFTIFKDWTPEIIFPLYIIIPSLALSVLSALMWILGEIRKK